jgi:hypothetical protein
MVPLFKSYAVSDDQGGPIGERPFDAVTRPNPII